VKRTPIRQVTFITLGVLLLSFCSTLSIAQTRKRVIVFPSWSASKEDEDVVLEVVEIRVNGKKIAFDTPFEAGDDWLRTMTLQIENVGRRPLSMIEIDGGLLVGIDEEPRLDELFEDRINWVWDSQADRPVHKGDWLKPEVALTFEYGSRSDFNSYFVSKKENPSFCQLNFVATKVRYFYGEEDSHPKVRFRLSAFR
jgi:hypothetical protein